MSFTSKDLEAVGAVLRDVARAEILPRFRTLSAAEVRTKSGPLDLVTDADEAAEIAIAEGLRRVRPGAVIIGEEAAAHGARWEDVLPDAEFACIIDPVDGTANFAAGLPLFGTMVGITRHGEPIGAAIHDPFRDDTAYALRGEGAWIAGADGQRSDLRVAPPVPLEHMTGNASWRYIPGPLRQRVTGALSRLAAVWDLRCAAHQYRLAAGGHCHFLFHYRLMPWDHAAGWLLHREAGGYSARFDGSPYRPAETSGGLICAPDRASWEALRETLLG
jgi:fructose-1,6-bisphosphatase/inositol monophosphatase family enzyme